MGAIFFVFFLNREKTIRIIRENRMTIMKVHFDMYTNDYAILISYQYDKL